MNDCTHQDANGFPCFGTVGHNGRHRNYRGSWDERESLLAKLEAEQRLPPIPDYRPPQSPIPWEAMRAEFDRR